MAGSPSNPVQLDPWQLIKEVGWGGGGGWVFIVMKTFQYADQVLPFCSWKFSDPASKIEATDDPPGVYTPTMWGTAKRFSSGSEWTEIGSHYWEYFLPFAEGGANPGAQPDRTQYQNFAYVWLNSVDTHLTWSPDSRGMTHYLLINWSKVKALYGHDQSKAHSTLGLMKQVAAQPNCWGDIRFSIQAYYYRPNTKFVYSLGGYWGNQKIWRAEEIDSPIPATPLATSGCLTYVNPGPHTFSASYETTPSYELSIGKNGEFLNWSGDTGSGGSCGSG